MTDPTSRTLALLNLLQTNRHWRGDELAERLGVHPRTVRRDIDRLRELGYRIESLPGALGGYRLEAGSAIPPLLLDDDEAVAIAVGLRVAASQRLVSGHETTVTALAKLEQVLSPPLRRRVNAIAATVQPAGITTGSPVSTALLGTLALACRDNERIRVTYTSASDQVTQRRLEPHTIAPADRHWYLLAWDLDRDDWRTFRVDRLSQPIATRSFFPPRPLTRAEVDKFILVARSWVRQSVEADVVMELPLDQMRAHFGQWGQGSTAEDDGHTRWPVGGADWRETFYGMTYIPAGIEFTTDLAEPARSELREALSRTIRALDAPPPARASN